MSTNTKALQLQKCEWLRAIRDGDGEQAKDILATVIVKIIPQQTAVLRAFQAAFANPMPIQQHLAGQSYLIKLLEEQLVQAKNEDTDEERAETSSRGSDDDAERARADDSDDESLTAVFKTPRPAAPKKKSSTANRAKVEKSEKRKKKRKKTDSKPIDRDSAEEIGRPNEDQELPQVKEKKGKNSTHRGNNGPNVNENHEDVEAAAAVPATPKPIRQDKTKGKAKQRPKKSQVEDAPGDEDAPQPGSSPQHAEKGSQRKAGAENPEAPARPTKKTKHDNKATTTHGQLPVRLRTHSATPGSSNVAPQVMPESRYAVNSGAQSSVATRMKEESDDDLQIFSSPTTPFKQYQPINFDSGGAGISNSLRPNDETFVDTRPSVQIHSVEDYSAHVDSLREREIARSSRAVQSGPSVRQAQLRAPGRNQANEASSQQAQLNPAARNQTRHTDPAAPAARQAAPTADAEPYRDPQGERQYKCRQCALWFVYSENHHGACLSRHPG
ncbi:hypothetical protein N0V82_004058 [Gnomoniopsis sp. IMI 355080]|nr:hypothetical protein N0V82_004058 [Gnomoniopsis sp. IMI 355080]